MEKEFLKRLMSEASGFQTPSPGNMSRWEVLEKFVEVIVKECADQFYLDEKSEATGQYIGDTIYKHFGMKRQ